MANEAFFTRFRGFVLICSLSGICIPGAEKLLPFQSRLLQQTYIRIFFLIAWFNFVDGILIAINYQITSVMLLRVVSTNAMIAWVLLTSMYMLTQQKNLKEIIQLWDEQQPELFQIKRQEILNKHTRLLWRKIKILACVQFLPYSLVYIFSICTGNLMTPSMLGNGLNREATPLKVMPQILSYVCWVTSYSLFQCFFTLFLRLILVDLDYLQHTLQEILSDLDISGDGSLKQATITDDEEFSAVRYRWACEEIHVKLKALVEYHIKVLRFAGLVKKVYTPIVFVEFFLLTTFLCSHLYCASEGLFDQDIAFMVGLNMGFSCLMTSLHCSLGENIRDMCFRLGDAAFYGNWMAYPLEIQKNLILIIQNTTERPVQFKPFGMYPLLLITFRQVTYLQYQFFMFLSETTR